MQKSLILIYLQDILNCDGPLLNCTTFVNQFRKKFGFVRKFKATKHPAAEALNEYAIITADLDKTKRTFSRLLTVRKAFHCINDVIEPTSRNYFDSDEFKEITELWLQFYLELFPDPSEFELPNLRNSCRYIDECRQRNVKCFIISLVISVSEFNLLIQMKKAN